MKKTDTLLNKKAVSVVAAGALALSLTPTVAFANADGVNQGGAAAQQEQPANAAANAGQTPKTLLPIPLLVKALIRLAMRMMRLASKRRLKRKLPLRA